jgi:hypothetical protein
MVSLPMLNVVMLNVVTPSKGDVLAIIPDSLTDHDKVLTVLDTHDARHK